MYNPVPGYRVRNIRFKNITYNGKGAGASRIHGFNDGRLVDGVAFENLQINGKVARKPADANIKIGKHVKNIRFVSEKEE